MVSDDTIKAACKAFLDAIFNDGDVYIGDETDMSSVVIDGTVDVAKGIRAALQSADGEAEQLKELVQLFVDGWTVERASLYDEEGIEGWRWTSPYDGYRQFDETGCWSEPPTISDAMREYLRPKQTP